jgi:mono/diheme cytochrome c family protein
VRRTGLAIAASLAGIVLASVAGVYAGSRNAVLLHAAGRPGILPPAAPASRARGEALYLGRARCAACHASDAGGALSIDSPSVATLWAPNLTRANPAIAAYGDADFERAIRRGLRPSGQRLLGMPSWDDAVLTDADVASIIAYLRSVRPVAREAPAFRFGIVGRVEVLSGRLAFDADRIGDARPAASRTPDLDVARVAGCLRCHAVPELAAPPPLPGERTGVPLHLLAGFSRDAMAAAVRADAPIPGHAAPALPLHLDALAIDAIRRAAQR